MVKGTLDMRLATGTPDAPSPFGKYWLFGLVARGGMAEVYRARDPKVPNALYAIKMMRPALAREAKFLVMFGRESRLSRMLKHPAIVETVDAGKIAGRHYLALQYIGGRDLADVMKRCEELRESIPIPHALYIASQICAALTFAHSLADDNGQPLHIVNRDVSPSNVRVSYEGEVKLLDFGVAQGLVRFTSEIGSLRGKFSYMSPEQIRGLPLDARSDIFSIGIVLHEMLTNEKLFRGDTEFALMEKVRKAEVPAPSQINRSITPELDAIVLKALSRDVDARYQTAEEFGKDIEALLTGFRFDTKEMRQFIRRLFRKELAREEEEVAQIRAWHPDDLDDALDPDDVNDAVQTIRLRAIRRDPGTTGQFRAEMPSSASMVGIPSAAGSSPGGVGGTNGRNSGNTISPNVPTPSQPMPTISRTASGAAGKEKNSSWWKKLTGR